MKTNFFRDYFSFSKSERVGIITLVILIVLLIVLPKFILKTTKSNKLEDSLYKVEVEEFIKSFSQSNQKTELQNRESDYTTLTTRRRSKYTPFPFDPNTATTEDYVKMGFSERQSAVMVKYREKGGKFFEREDFNKLYVVDDETYKTFEPYIRIKNQTKGIIHTKDISTTNDKNFGVIKKDVVFKEVVIELNSADSMQLLSINGVGPVFASRILKYRKLLGGFYEINQLKEVYGIDSARFEGIKNQVYSDTALITRINLNAVSLEQLRKHPYFDYTTAKAVIDKRIQSNSFKSLSDVKSILDKKGKFGILRHYLILN